MKRVLETVEYLKTETNNVIVSNIWDKRSIQRERWKLSTPLRHWLTDSKQRKFEP